MYGSSLARAYYGAGDYQRRVALAQYAGGRYAAGGFFSSLKKGISKLASNPLAQSVASFIPGASSTLAFAKLATGGGTSGLGALAPLGGSTLTGIGKLVGVGAGKKAAPIKLAGFGGLAGLQGTRAAPKRRKKRSTRRRSSSRRRRRPAGDWGDPGGRDKRGHFLGARGGHRHFRRRRRRGGRSRGQRVSFVTKAGKRVSFTAR